ncbi:uncharacterized protein MONBRDRAFT_21466 [Monosiga brevicollis MX1]|uniref:beta-N-acetylhexosaminidase n=1 Tax=Monosiga brevicollis TaxID=81824 RepID=A9UY60_MONBE|nr:uncharacterized protein MONBRDRAFT_21466 [Monosiga brevicollis MX1]EDQ89965.1 predicted protein [Monosiga brevicollis MX1]|eukprot:XP_001745387.1 hypothetical protein [Monosiga brevicollis MX1]
MSFNKLSLLHWHLVDEMSFPYQPRGDAANLGKGAYSTFEQYSADDLTYVVEFAKARGVRVMFEIDTPGHADSWKYGFPNVVTDCPNTIATYSSTISMTTLDPSQEETFQVLSDLFTDLSKIIEDPFIHMGGDEVFYACWKESARVTAFMNKQGYDGMLYTLVKAGYRAILANGPNGEWYLNDGFGNGDIYQLWTDVYGLEPFSGQGDLTPAEAARVLGGEVSLWSEEIHAGNLMGKAWPRASAFAERMWSSQAVNDPYEAAPRLARMVCKLNAMGIAASPISPGSCYPRQP